MQVEFKTKSKGNLKQINKACQSNYMQYVTLYGAYCQKQLAARPPVHRTNEKFCFLANPVAIMTLTASKYNSVSFFSGGMTYPKATFSIAV